MTFVIILLAQTLLYNTIWNCTKVTQLIYPPWVLFQCATIFYFYFHFSSSLGYSYILSQIFSEPDAHSSLGQDLDSFLTAPQLGLMRKGSYFILLFYLCLYGIILPLEHLDKTNTDTGKAWTPHSKPLPRCNRQRGLIAVMVLDVYLMSAKYPLVSKKWVRSRAVLKFLMSSQCGVNRAVIRGKRAMLGHRI